MNYDTQSARSDKPSRNATYYEVGLREKKGPGPKLMGADTLIGNEVFNTQDEYLGDIKDIMLDIHTGEVVYAILSWGGFLGVGEKLFAVPWRALTLDTQHKAFVLPVSKERLKGASGFDKDQWPDMTNATWAQGIHSFYGTRPAQAKHALDI